MKKQRVYIFEFLIVGLLSIGGISYAMEKPGTKKSIEVYKKSCLEYYLFFKEIHENVRSLLDAVDEDCDNDQETVFDRLNQSELNFCEEFNKEAKDNRSLKEIYTEIDSLSESDMQKFLENAQETKNELHSVFTKIEVPTLVPGTFDYAQRQVTKFYRDELPEVYKEFFISNSRKTTSNPRKKTIGIILACGAAVGIIGYIGYKIYKKKKAQKMRNEI